MDEFVSVSDFVYNGYELYNVGDGDSFCYCPCNIYGTPKLYYADCHFSCAGDALQDILDSFHGGDANNVFSDDEWNDIVQDIWLNCISEPGRVYYGKYIVVGFDGHIPDKEYVDGVISYLGGSYNDYVILYNEGGKVHELGCDSCMNGNGKPTKLSVPNEVIQLYNIKTSRMDTVNRKFPTNMTRAEYYSLIRQENTNRIIMKQRIRLTESDLHRIVKESVNKVLKENFDRAAFENACDDLYYGYGFNYWRKQHSYLDPITADKIWHAAFKKMSEDPSADFVPHSIESYDDMMRQNDERLNVQPSDNGRYPDENLNVLDSDGSDSLYAQGGGPNGVPNKLKGMKAIKMGGMGLGTARDEYEKNFDTINKSKNAQRTFKQGRIGNERPLHRKGSLNRAFDD